MSNFFSCEALRRSEDLPALLPQALKQPSTTPAPFLSAINAYCSQATMAEHNASHEEVWDDSELVDSWNAAFEEYKVRKSSFAWNAYLLWTEIPQPSRERRESQHRAKRIACQWRHTSFCSS